MARLISIFIGLFFVVGNCVIAQQYGRVNKAVYVSKAGTLIDNITLEEAQTVTHLTVTGTINAVDFKHLRNDFDKLSLLDLSNATIQSYIGKRGTAPNEKFANYGAHAIPAYAFSFCVENDIAGKSTLREIVLPDKIKNIEENAFMGCNNLRVCRIIKAAAPNISKGGLDPNVTAVFIPEGIKYAYDRKLAWRDFVIVEGAPTRVSVQVNTPGTLNQEIEKKLKATDGKRNVKDVNFLAVKGTLNRDDYSFISDFMNNLIAINLYNTNTTVIPSSTFANKRNLLKVALPKDLVSIGEKAFSECERLNGTLLLPKTVKEIETGAFINTSLKDVVVTGGHLSKLGKNIFGEGDGKLILSIDDSK